MRGFLAYGFAFVMISLVLLFFFFVVNPILLETNTYLADAGEDMLQDINVSSINNPEVRSALNTSIQSARTSIPKSSQIIGTSIKYSWLIFLIVLFVLFFIYTRELSEVGRPGGLM